MQIMTITDPRTGQSSARPATWLTDIERTMFAAAAAKEGLVITYSTR